MCCILLDDGLSPADPAQAKMGALGEPSRQWFNVRAGGLVDVVLRRKVMLSLRHAVE